MNRFLNLVLILVTLVTLSGCGGANWWQVPLQNPATSASSLEQQVRMFLVTAEIAYTAFSPLLPADKKSTIDADYQKVVAGVNHALSALDDAVSVAADMQQAKPDLKKETAGVVAAVDELHALVDTFKTSSPAAAAAAAPTSINPHPVLALAIPDLASRHKAIHRHQKLAAATP